MPMDPGSSPRPRRVRMDRLVLLGLGLLLVGLVIYLSLASLESMPSVEIPFSDKVEHFIAYGVMMLWFGQIIRGRRGAILTAAGLVALGVALEFIQAVTPYRSFELSDMASNAVGVLAGFLLSRTRLGYMLFALERALGR